MKKTLFVLIPTAIFFFSIGVAYSYFKPKLERVVLYQIRSISERHLPVLISAESFELHLLPPSAELSDIKIVPKVESKLGFELSRILNIRANLDFLQLLGGHISFSTIVVQSPEIELHIDDIEPSPSQSSATSTELKIDQIFNVVRKLPVRKLAIIDINVSVDSNKKDWQVDVDNSNLLVSFERDRIGLQGELGNIQATWKNAEQTAAIQIDGVLTPEMLSLKEFKLTGPGTTITASGQTKSLKQILSAPSADLQFDVHSDLQVLSTDIKLWFPFPDMKGNVRLIGQTSFEKLQLINANYEIQSKALKIENFDVGEIWAKGIFKNNEFQVPTFQIENPSGMTELNQIVAKFIYDNEKLSSITFNAKLRNDGLDLHDLLFSLGIGDLPVELIIGAQFDCGGPLYPDFKLNCKGSAEGSHLEVSSGSSSKIIARVEDFAAKGEVTVSGKEVFYKADLDIDGSKGTSEGVIGYDTGFVIKYDSPELDLKNLSYLANLKLEGKTKVWGETSGGSHSAIFSINLDGHDMVLDNYKLGTVKGLFRYEKGMLLFENIQGLIGTSKYNAQVKVDLAKSTIQFDGSSPRIEVSDVASAFDRLVKLPIEIGGSGPFKISGRGPLQFNQLSYILQTDIQKGTAAGENFDQLSLDVHADHGEVTIQKARLTKDVSVAVLSGEAHPNGQINFAVKGTRFLLEQSENISKLNSNITGTLNFNLKLNGHILDPDIALHGDLVQLAVDEQEFPSSTANLNFNKRTIEGTAQLFGQRLKTEFVFPLDDKAPFLLKAQANDWDYTTAFAILASGSQLNDYRAGLTGVIDLSSDRGGFFNASGHSTIEKFILQRGNLNLKNSGPIEMQMRSGNIALKNFKLSGDQSSLEIVGENFSRNNLDVAMRGKTNLRLLQIFFPFLEELSGEAKIQAQLTGAILKPELLGSTQIKNGFVKLKGFPHPFEKIEGDAEFSHSQISINHINGVLGGGQVTGDGSVQIKGLNEIPVNIRARIENATLMVPDHIRTTGTAELSITGSWFPFTLAGTYRISSGLIDKEFGDDNFAGITRQSSYLPKMILRGAFEPINLDLQVVIERPLQIKNSNIDGNVTGALQVKGTPTQPQIMGKVITEKNSKLLFKDKAFDINAANVQFNDPKEMNPDIYVSARTRVLDYDVSLLAQGTAKAPVIRLTSTPPLSEPDIISLLVLGQTSANFAKSTANTSGSENAYQLGTAIFSNAFGKGIQNLGFNVQFSSTYDDTKNATVRKVTISRDITKKITVSASNVQGLQSANEFKLRYSFDPNVSAVASFETRESTETSKTNESLTQTQNILGLDLEYKQEFK